jgi:hypothetical protein
MRLVHLMKQLLAPEMRGSFEPGFEHDLRTLWTRMDVQAALRAHGSLDDELRGISNARTIELAEIAARDAVAGSGLRACALGAACGKRETARQQFKICSACRAVAYCCREHQAAHWRKHKADCKKMADASRSSA